MGECKLQVYLHNEKFNIANWYAKCLQLEYQRLARNVFWLPSDKYANCNIGCLFASEPMPEQLAETIHAVKTMRCWMADLQHAIYETNGHLSFLEVNGTQIQRRTCPSIQQTSAHVRDPS